MQEPSPDPKLSPEGCESLELLLLPAAMLRLDNVAETLPGPLPLDEDPTPEAREAPPAITLEPPPPASSLPPIPEPTPATPSTVLRIPPQHPQTHPQAPTPTQAPPHPPPPAPIDRTTTPAQTPRPTPLPLFPPAIPGITLLPETPEGSRVDIWIRTLTPYFPQAAGFTIFPTIKVCPRTHVMYDLITVYAGRTGPYLTTVMGYDRPPEPDAWARRVQVLQDEWRRGVAGGMPVYGAVWVGDEVRWFCGGGS
ncbi:hypothetical protein BO86DRAFT_437640 [Aspergillus japonicus CBS 114.51]|uniref:Uncharacterized protein n=1 Tax=Aspergillus japonicus CBS 114.51 TaxID=1448312 RepID=A0A8T8WSV1_ASPJA|nr:hypothetical protein BO86DRAFT_437640 [Aspergillus japonicus CBS 114.51]RAH78744.1 hypothetical protein BO86DRAFT_437640 [Aspergillus japonicus CBS 114.51]